MLAEVPSTQAILTDTFVRTILAKFGFTELIVSSVQLFVLSYFLLFFQDFLLIATGEWEWSNILWVVDEVQTDLKLG